MKDSDRQDKPWYADKNQDSLYYLLIAVFFIELIVGGVAFFYGIIHAEPESPGGPPMARFPWLIWALASVLAPVALLLIVHLTGSLLSSTLKRDQEKLDPKSSEELPEGMRRFYAAIRHAPTVVILIAILLLGAVLFFVDGAFALLSRLFENLVPYIPWLAASIAALLAVCFITHAIMVYRQRRMENEYAWRREVLEKTGLVITDSNSRTIPLNGATPGALPNSQKGLPEAPILEIETSSTPPGDEKMNHG